MWATLSNLIQQLVTATNGIQTKLSTLFAVFNYGTGIGTVNSPVTWASTIGTASIQIIGANTTNRVGLMFHNPGTVNLYICPSIDHNGSAIAAGSAGSIILTPGQTMPIVGLCSAAWNASAAAGGANLVTVLEFLY